MLSSRQEQILCKVVDGYLQTGAPVGSRAIAGDPNLDCSPSTVRNELSLLEELGLLSHPHTSAGRVPTDAGHRYVVDRMLTSASTLPVPRRRLELGLTRREIDEAMRTTTRSVSQMTNLLAVVSAPSINAATVRHVEVLSLQPRLVLVVIITSTGGVSKMLATFEEPVDPGLVGWAAEYLNERLIGRELGARMVAQRLLDPGLTQVETEFLSRFAPALADVGRDGEEALYFDGTALLFDSGEVGDAVQIKELVALLERRVALLEVLRTALGESDVYVRIGHENELPAMHSLAMVATGYGMGSRKLGTVSVIGPVRMDYAEAIATVREAGQELSRFVEDAYAET